jgi:hypothetical protein
MYSAEHTTLFPAPLGASCFIPLLKELRQITVGRDHKHFAPNGARTTRTLWKGTRNHDDES